MGAAVETLPRTQGIRSSMLKSPIVLRSSGTTLSIDPSGAVRSFGSLAERRALFGYEQVWVFKLQAGVVVQAQRPDWGVRVTPRSAQLAGRLWDGAEMSQSFEFHRGASMGYIRRVKLRNGGQSQLKLRIVGLSDPTAAQLGDQATWGSIGVNAFNRGSHVAMDEVSDPPSARVVGVVSTPAKFYMTTDRLRAQDLVSTGDSPEPTAGMSGQVLIVSSVDFELAPGESKEVVLASIYNPAKLEDALADFARVATDTVRPAQKGPRFASSSPQLAEAAAWATSVLEGATYQEDALDRFECLIGLNYSLPGSARLLAEGARRAMRKDGSVPHSMDQTQAGALETSLLLNGMASHLVIAQDKKVARTFYPLVKQLAGYLLSISKEFSVEVPPTLPQGWRRRVRTGYPTGEVPEVTLAVSAALLGASRAARLLGKSEDAGKFRERSEMVADRAQKSLVDERGYFSLCLDSSGKLRLDETIDMAITSFRHPSATSPSQASCHRLLEKDFETPYGPRVVPTSNRVYFSRTYGQGQLGGYWTRAALAHSIVCYRSGLPGIGSLGLKRVAKLVVEDVVKLGGSPGEFPFWVDPEGGEVSKEGSDAVAASRYIESLVECELGLALSEHGPSFAPPDASSVAWLLASEFWAGEPTTAFVGRTGGKAHLFLCSTNASASHGMKFAKAEVLEQTLRGVHAVSFYEPGQLICVGNSSAAPARGTVTFSPKAPELSRQLSVPLEAYDPYKGSWSKSSSLRVGPTMSFEVQLAPEEWRAYRVSSGG